MIKENRYLELNEVSIGYGDYVLLDAINLVVLPGSIIRVVGDNGSGKSSLLRTLAGSHDCLRGQINYGVEPFLIETGSPFHTELTTHENLKFWQNIFQCPVATIDSIKHQFYLKSLWNTPIKHLSCGQKQRLKLSLLMLTNKKLWLIDEPNESLDIKGQNLVQEIFNTHLRQGGSIIYTNPKLIQDSLNISNETILDLNNYYGQPL